MELFRALAALAEMPDAHTARLAQLVGLEAAPDPAAYTNLFVFQQVPYASAYVSADGMIGGEPRDRIAGFWRALGLDPPNEPDHLATMLGAYAALCDCAHTESDARRRAALARARHAFLWEHLLSWLPGYLHAVPRHAAAPYVTWARLLLDALLEEARMVGAPAGLPLHLREVPPLPDPRRDGLDGFLAALLAPGRSGVILTRADLARGAHTLELGMRAGDRPLALRSLLEQDAAATFGWIAAEARAAHAQHQALATTIGPLAAAWSARALATAVLIDELRNDALEEHSA